MAAPTTTAAIYLWDLSSTSNPSASAPVTSTVNPWTDLQPGLDPPLSIPSGYDWNSFVISGTTYTLPTGPAAQNAQTTSSVSSGHKQVLPTLASAQSSVKHNSTSTAVSSNTTTGSLSCNKASATFTVDFDDLPSFSTGPDDTDIPPIFSPYHELFWQGHFGYVPPPTDPFPPHSPPQLAVYRAGSPIASASGGLDLQLNGEIGAGPRANRNAYWIDVHSAWLGCANGGPSDCIITVHGYIDGGSSSRVTQNINLPPCPGLKNCSLALVNFDGGFRGLTGLQILATADAKAVDYYIDDLHLGWSNNSCAAQLLRSSSE